MRPWDVSAQREGEGERVLRGRDRVRLRGVRDHDPALRRRLDVDVVDAGARTAYHLQPLRPLDQIRRHLRSRADQKGVELADPLAELVVGHLEPELDVELTTQQVDPRLGDRLPDEHALAH